MTLHHPPHPAGHLRHGLLHALARQPVGDGRARARRQRLRRRGRRRLRAARRRAAPQRPRRRRARDRRHRRGPRRRGCSAARARRRRGATIEHYRALGLDLVPGSGPLAAAVPGAVDAWLLLLRDHGTLPLADVLAPAIGYAARRSPAAAPGRRHRRRGARSSSSERLAHLGGALAAPAAGHPAPGEIFRNPAYATTLRAARRRGPRRRRSTARRRSTRARRAWSQGFVAEAVDAFSRQPFRDSSGAAHAGLVTGEDLAAFSRDLGGAGHPRVRAGTRSPRPAPGGRARCCCRRWRSSTRSTTRAEALLDPSTVDGIARPRRGAQARLRRPGGAGTATPDVPLADAALPGVRARSARR